MVDVVEILTHWQAGRSSREISTSLGVSRNTVARYVAPAARAGLGPDGPESGGAEWAERVRRWFPDLVDTRVRQSTAPEIERHRDYIVQQRRHGVTMATIHQRLADEHGLGCSVASLRRWVTANLPDEQARAERVAVLRPDPRERRDHDHDHESGQRQEGPESGLTTLTPDASSPSGKRLTDGQHKALTIELSERLRVRRIDPGVTQGTSPTGLRTAC
ncbi:hypothetical protein [Actinomadura harenae]|uniref:Transposase n=1 Tax=Actinomadura harenae TaxID=2483351 RepID=A0A3M2M993_9ACTN|nr:hypothetical protein [Actinomadura harenae]RMI46116.1 hypothetical protein EBO15_07785 [Actinomadura harenae]